MFDKFIFNRFEYASLQKKFNSTKLFNQTKIIIPIRAVFPFDNSVEDDFYHYAEHYRIRPLECEKCDGDVDNPYYLYTEQVIREINNGIKDRANTLDWSLFYLYKELIQRFILQENDESGRLPRSFNYYRGQENNWILKPGIFRVPGTRFINEFENLYKSLAEDYPEKIKYFSYFENKEKRATALGVLQHYGFKTSLVDITENPFVAMLFMLDNKKRYVIGKKNSADNSDLEISVFGSKTLDMFAIDEDKDATCNIFTKVFHTEINKRIAAQKGSFFFYDKLFDLKKRNIEKIPRITIELKYDYEYSKSVIEDRISERERDLVKLKAAILPYQKSAERTKKSILQTAEAKEALEKRISEDSNIENSDLGKKDPRIRSLAKERKKLISKSADLIDKSKELIRESQGEFARNQDLIENLEHLIQQEIKNLEKFLEQIHDGGAVTSRIMDEIEFQLSSKLGEYHYYRKDLFPDFVDRLAYIQQDYVD
ncbi:FRG domain-containing protein [Leuconostocaceae bacterium ESL0723]|nr:FRG domain-containing protein [Leuconostocaceae bacterium ESL0723]